MNEIDRIETELLRVPNDEPLEDATQSFDALELVLVRIARADGVRGIGFTYTIGSGGRAIQELIETSLASTIRGTSAGPRDAHERLRAASTFIGREGLSELAISAIDIALWDGLAKRFGAPLVEMLGGHPKALPAYDTNVGWLHLDEATLIENARSVAESEFVGMKMKLGRGLAEDEARVRAVRNALPGTDRLMLDANCGLTVAETRRFCRRIDELAIDWLEEPIEKGDYGGYSDLRSLVNMPIASGENLYSPMQFRQLVECNGADVLQPDVCRVGGITGWMQVAQLAEAHGLELSPHYIEPIHAHLACCTPAATLIEHHSTVLDRVTEIDTEAEAGSFRPGTAPGHGIRFVDIEKYRVT